MLLMYQPPTLSYLQVMMETSGKSASSLSGSRPFAKPSDIKFIIFIFTIRTVSGNHKHHRNLVRSIRVNVNRWSIVRNLGRNGVERKESKEWKGTSSCTLSCRDAVEGKGKRVYLLTKPSCVSTILLQIIRSGKDDYPLPSKTLRNSNEPCWMRERRKKTTEDVIRGKESTNRKPRGRVSF